MTDIVFPLDCTTLSQIMSFVKSPYFPAVICLLVIGIVIFMLFRDVNSMKGTMTDLVTQHNNAQKALETHGGQIKRLQEVGLMDDEDDMEYEDDGEFGEEYDHRQSSLPTIKEEELCSDPGPSKRSKDI